MKYLGLIIAIGVAMAAAFFVLQFSQKEAPAPTTETYVAEQAPAAVEETTIYVAARDITIGTKIDPNMLTTRPWPKHLVIEGFVDVNNDPQGIIGTVARASFKRDEPINRVKLVNPDDPNFLAGTLPKGKRVVTIQTDEIAGVAGFIFPGDHVDILITHNILREGVTEDELQESGDWRELTEEVTETLLHDILVLAVDQRATAGIDEDEGIVIPGSVSLEVSPEDAQRLRLAGEIGQLSMALRSVDDKDVVETIAITRRADLSQFEMGSDEEGEDSKPMVGKSKKAVRIIRGTNVQTVD